MPGKYCRKTDSPYQRQRFYPRSDRFHCENGKWYVSLRGGALLGPFASQDDAKAGLEDFLSERLYKRVANLEFSA